MTPQHFCGGTGAKAAALDQLGAEFELPKHGGTLRYYSQADLSPLGTLSPRARNRRQHSLGGA